MSVFVKEIAIEPNTVAIYERFRMFPYSFFLDSSLASEGQGRYSYIGASPFAILRSKGKEVIFSKGGKTIILESSPLKALLKIMQQYKVKPYPDCVPFLGGAVGYFSYDFGRTLEKLPSNSVDDLDWPDIELGFYDSLIAIDHHTKRVFAIAVNHSENSEVQAKAKLNEISALTQEAKTTSVQILKSKQERNTDGMIECTFDRNSYCKAVEKVKEHILKGDVYILNLSKRFSLPFKGDTFRLYKILRTLNPAPFSAYLEFGKHCILCSSPEHFLEVKEGFVKTRPIKGTRPRGKNEEEDRLFMEELRSDPKEQAELAMVIDIERNDLGRVCKPGSVQVKDLYKLEPYSTVFQMVATVVGELEANREVVDLMAAVFPGGSVTGAPKIRAMEIIDQLEPVRRALYTGSIGCLGFNGYSSLNIAIRSIFIKNEKAYLSTGGGITIDSDPEAEFEETEQKARALLEALKQSVGSGVN